MRSRSAANSALLLYLCALMFRSTVDKSIGRLTTGTRKSTKAEQIQHAPLEERHTLIVTRCFPLRHRTLEGRGLGLRCRSAVRTRWIRGATLPRSDETYGALELIDDLLQALVERIGRLGLSLIAGAIVSSGQERKTANPSVIAKIAVPISPELRWKKDD